MPEQVTAAAADSSTDGQTQCADDEKILTLNTLNPHLKDLKGLVAYGLMNKRVNELDLQLAQGTLCKPFNRVLRADIGDCHACGQKPLTFMRQVIALCTYDALFDSPLIPEDAKRRARRMLASCPGESIGSYTETAGLTVVRKDVARFITNRDGHDCDFNDIFLAAGATNAIRVVLKLLTTGKDDTIAGYLLPFPQYPVYMISVREYNSAVIPYQLDEEKQWSVNIGELQGALDAARLHCIPRAIVVINPGNPTGQVLSRQNIEDIIKFAHKEKLFILADEVYQQNVYPGHGNEFHSFKKVMKEMGGEFADMPLASFMSTSKGYTGECGYRGGYCELINIDPDVRRQLIKLISTSSCPTVTGQVAVGVLVNPPQEGEPSYELFEQEKADILGVLAQKAKLVSTVLNQIDGVRCNEISGAMYAFPRIFIPEKAIQEAKANGQEPDVMYCSKLLEEAGVFVLPGETFGQKEGTYHFRMTILPSVDELTQLLDRFKRFHDAFTAQYS